MPRGFKRSAEKVYVADGYVGRLLDAGSFISQAKIIKGECDEPRPHLILVGEDKTAIRALIFKRDRATHPDGLNHCWKCGREVWEHPWSDNAPSVMYYRMKYRPMPTSGAGEWDHIRNKPGERCDCPENGRVACHACHLKRHPRPRFGPEKKVGNKGII